MNKTIHHRPSSESDAPSFRDMFIKRKETVKQLLEIYMKNLNRLEIRAAGYGVLDVPTRLSNEIERTREQIYHLMREFRRQEGILSELDALSQEEQ